TVTDVRAVQQNRSDADQAPILDRAPVQDGGVPDRDAVANRRGMRSVHHVDHGAVLDVRAAADANPVHIAPDDDRHPHTALLADLDVTDHLRTVVDERGRVDARKRVAKPPEHQRIIAGLSLNSRWRRGARSFWAS